MAKDPAINWYFDNWSGGTKLMSRFLKGCYIDLLDAQFHSGHLSLEEIKIVLGADYSAWSSLSKKFAVDETGKYFNERLDHEILKRENFSNKQKERVNKRWNKNGIYHGNTTVLPINETGTETGIGISSFEKSEKLFFELTISELNNSIEYLDRVAQKKFTQIELISFWEAFKIQYCKEFYPTRRKVIQHFRDWLKKQNNGTNGNKTGGASKRIDALKQFVNG